MNTTPTNQLDEPQDSLNQDQALRHLLHLSPKDVTLKFVFDHIRNYAICGGMLYAGTRVVQLNSEHTNCIDYAWNLIAWSVLFALPWLLFALNFAHGVFAAFTLQKADKVRTWVYMIGALIIFIAASKFMVSFLGGR